MDLVIHRDSGNFGHPCYHGLCVSAMTAWDELKVKITRYMLNYILIRFAQLNIKNLYSNSGGETK